MIKTEGERLKELREKFGLTQKEMGDRLGFKQTYIGQVERGERNKSVSGKMVKSLIREWPDINIAWLKGGKGEPFLVERDASEGVLREPVTPYTSGNFLVPAAAQAGYIGDWSQEWMDQNLVPISIPEMTSGIFRTFEVAGDSMRPTIQDGDLVVGRRLDKISEIRPNRVHIVVSRLEGIYIKRVVLDDHTLILESDNDEFRAISMPGEDIKEIYYAERRITASFSGPRPENARIDRVEQFLGSRFKDFSPYDTDDSPPLKTPKQ